MFIIKTLLMDDIMKLKHIKNRLNTFQLLLTVFSILMLGSCGGSSNSSSDSPSGSGALFFKIAYHLATNDLQRVAIHC
jgi:hypothetical protein